MTTYEKQKYKRKKLFNMEVAKQLLSDGWLDTTWDRDIQIIEHHITSDKFVSMIRVELHEDRHEDNELSITITHKEGKQIKSVEIYSNLTASEIDEYIKLTLTTVDKFL